jgi:nicotinamide phosphoribosyltransferase
MLKIPGFSALYNSDGYKVGHKAMLAPGTTRLYGTWIPRSTKHAGKDINKIVSFGQQLVVKWLHEEFEENFFYTKTKRQWVEGSAWKIEDLKIDALQFVKDMSLYLGQPYDGKHFEELWDLGYLPIEIQALPEGIETNPNIPHMTFINTVDGFAWLTLYLETFISSLAWKASTSATLALAYKRRCYEWVMKTDPENAWLIPWLCHDFSARGLDPYSQIASGLGHATSFMGSDTLAVIPSARFFYNEPQDQVAIGSVNASEHSVSTTKIFTVGEKQMIIDWLKEFPTGILSIVADTFDLWKLITEYLQNPEVKALIMARDGKLVIRPDSGDPVDIICGYNIFNVVEDEYSSQEIFEDGYNAINANGYVVDKNEKKLSEAEQKGVIELLWNIFGGTINEQGYKILDSHIGAIYGDSINLERQQAIYKRLEAKGFAATNIVLGVGSFTYQFNTRDTFGFAAKGAWFEVDNSLDCVSDCKTCKCVKENKSTDFCNHKLQYNIYKDPVTDDGTKKSLKGFQYVYLDVANNEYCVASEMTEQEVYHDTNILKTIYKNGEFFNQTTLTEVRDRINKLL